METEKRKLGRKKMVKSTLNSSGSVIFPAKRGTMARKKEEKKKREKKRRREKEGKG